MKNYLARFKLAVVMIAVLAALLGVVGSFNAPIAWAQSQLLEGTVLGGRIYSSGGKPTTVTCTIADGATNMAGRVTAAGGATSCVVTFVANGGAAAAWTQGAPVCMVVDETAVRAAMTTTVTTTTLTVAALTTADVFTYFCVGRT